MTPSPAAVMLGEPMNRAVRTLEDHRAAVRERLLRSNHVRPGPGSVTWKVNRELIVIAGWGRAILLQLAHPAVAAAVHDHSGFRGSLGSSLRRLRSTVGAMLTIMFGDTDALVNAAAGINLIHDRVQGNVHEGTSGPYSAHDPGLQRWVHVTLVDSILRTYELLVGPLTPDERDQYCAEATIMEPLLAMPSNWLPRDAAQLDSYMREMLASGSLVFSPGNQSLARAVLYPPKWQVGWPAFRAVQLLTIGLLPAAVRQAYGFDWRPGDARAFTRWMRFLRALVRLLPPFARQWPMARRRVPIGQHVRVFDHPHHAADDTIRTAKARG